MHLREAPGSHSSVLGPCQNAQDLAVSPDFLYYFSQTVPLLDQDDTLLTVSAWNDNSYQWTSADPARLYRTHVCRKVLG